MMSCVKTWISKHPSLWEFILFNILSNVATIVNFIVMWICTGFFNFYRDFYVRRLPDLSTDEGIW